MSFAPLANAPFIIQLHTVAAFAAAVSGILILLRAKGTRPHKFAGYVFTFTILLSAVSSFWITGLAQGRYSWIHLLSVITLISVPMGIIYRRVGNIRGHAASMIAPFVGLIIAGAFAFMPGRIMGQVAFGP